MLCAANDPFSTLRFHVVEDRCHRDIPSSSRGEIFEYLNNASIDFAALHEPIGNVRVDNAAALRLLEQLDARRRKEPYEMLDVRPVASREPTAHRRPARIVIRHPRVFARSHRVIEVEPTNVMQPFGA